MADLNGLLHSSNAIRAKSKHLESQCTSFVLFNYRSISDVDHKQNLTFIYIWGFKVFPLNRKKGKTFDPINPDIYFTFDECFPLQHCPDHIHSYTFTPGSYNSSLSAAAGVKGLDQVHLSGSNKGGSSAVFHFPRPHLSCWSRGLK